MRHRVVFVWSFSKVAHCFGEQLRAVRSVAILGGLMQILLFMGLCGLTAMVSWATSLWTAALRKMMKEDDKDVKCKWTMSWTVNVEKITDPKAVSNPADTPSVLVSSVLAWILTYLTNITCRFVEPKYQKVYLLVPFCPCLQRLWWVASSWTNPLIVIRSAFS